MEEAESVVREFSAAYARDDRAAARALLADDVVGYVSNAAAGVDRVDGAEAYMERLPTLDDASITLEVTQSVIVAPGQALTMIVIGAEREGKTLHNFAAFLTKVSDGLLTEIWMVEALPEYSDQFWSS